MINREYDRVYIKDFRIEESPKMYKLIGKLMNCDNYTQFKINLFLNNINEIKDQRVKTWYTHYDLGIYIIQHTIHLRFSSMFEMPDNLNYKLLLRSFSIESNIIILDLYTENNLFDYLNIVHERDLRIKYNPNTEYESRNYKIRCKIDNKDIYKSNKLYKYYIPIFQHDASIFNRAYISCLYCIIIGKFEDTEIRIELDDDINNYIATYINIRNCRFDNYYLEIYSNKKLKHPEEIKILNVNRTNDLVCFELRNIGDYNDIFFWDKSFKTTIKSITNIAVNDIRDVKKSDIHKIIKEKENTNIISWDQYFMGVAELSAKRSKDPNRQVGACIVKDKVIVGTGYNGFPRGCSDKEFPWTKDSKEITETKYAYVVHAELNAILNSTRDLNDSIIYVTLFPCTECTKAIIQSGIKKVIYKEKSNNLKEIKASKKMFKAAGIIIEEYK